MRTVINRSLNQTLSRTLITTGLTLFVVVSQFVVNFGSGSDLASFAFAMIVGMICGTYSTMYIAAPTESPSTATRLALSSRRDTAVGTRPIPCQSRPKNHSNRPLRKVVMKPPHSSNHRVEGRSTDQAISL